jgi:hypothetical protein
MLWNCYSITVIKLKIMVKKLKHYFTNTSGYTVTIPKYMYKTHVKKYNFLLSRKSNEVTFFWKECDKLLVIRYLILSGTVPQQ